MTRMFVQLCICICIDIYIYRSARVCVCVDFLLSFLTFCLSLAFSLSLCLSLVNLFCTYVRSNTRIGVRRRNQYQYYSIWAEFFCKTDMMNMLIHFRFLRIDLLVVLERALSLDKVRHRSMDGHHWVLLKRILFPLVVSKAFWSIGRQRFFFSLSSIRLIFEDHRFLFSIIWS